jgi:hypothetical protein
MTHNNRIFEIRVKMSEVDPTRGLFEIMMIDSEGGIECPIQAYMTTLDAPMGNMRIKMAFDDIRESIIEAMRKHSENGSVVFRNKNKSYTSKR